MTASLTGLVMTRTSKCLLLSMSFRVLCCSAERIRPANRASPGAGARLMAAEYGMSCGHLHLVES